MQLDETHGVVSRPGEGERLVSGGPHFSRQGPGTFVSAPPGVEHTFGKPGRGRARLLNIHAPDAGFADRLREISA